MTLNFKKLIQLCLLSLAALVLAYLVGTPETSTAAPLKTEQAKKKTILFLAGRPSHANGEHEFRAGSMLLAKALNESGLPIEAKVHYYDWPKDESIFDGVDACIVYANRGGNFKEKYAVLDQKVKEGMGIMFMHYGVHPNKAVGEKYYLPWIGGYMDDHVSVNPHWIADLAAKKDHPISHGIDKPVTALDEFYYNMIFDEKCEQLYPLITAIPTEDKIIRYINMWNAEGEAGLGKEQSLMWTRDPEKGARGIGFVGGHYHKNWAIDGFRQLVLNAIVWVARGEVPPNGVPSKPITLKQLNENLDRPTGKLIALPSQADLERPPMKRPDLSKPRGKQKKNAKVTKPNHVWSPKTKPIHVPVEDFTVSSDDLEVTLWAKSPQVYNPTNIDIDHKGRVWVAEGVNYRRHRTRRPGGDRIVVLEDTDKDGTADKTTVFLQSKDLKAPLGVSVFDNKVVVPNPPHLVVYTDVNRNLVFDEGIDTKENLITGFNGEQHDHSLHSVTHGPDGRWHFNSGNCGAIFTDRSGKTFNMNGIYRAGGGKFFTDNHLLGGKKSDDGFLWTAGFGVRINPDGTDAEITGHGFRNSYEHSINSMGDMFQSDNDDISSARNSYILEYGSAGFFTRDGQLQWRSVARPGQSTPSAHWRQQDPGTFDAGDIYGLGSPTGNVIYENGALGDDWIGSYFACEAARNTIFGYKPKQQGASFELNRFDFITTNQTKEYVGNDYSKRLKSLDDADSLSVLFRPSDIAVGADGALYVADWFDGRVGGHSSIDPSCSGAIYRIAPKGFQSKIPVVDYTTTEGQITALKSPAINTRHNGFHGLKAQGEAAYSAVVPLLDDSNEYIASRAIHLLPYLGSKGIAKCESLLQSNHANTRLVAYRALRRAKHNILPYAAMLANDSNTAIRRDVALSLRHYSADQTKDLFTIIAKGYDGHDKNYVEAIGLGSENKEAAIWQHLRKSLGQQDPRKWNKAFANITRRLWTPEALDDLKIRASDAALSQKEREFAVESISFINHSKAAETMLELASQEAIKESVAYWLLKRGTTEWQKYNLAGELKTRGIYDPDTIKVTSITVPAPKAPSFAVEDVLALTGNAEAGKTKIMSCVMCHEINGVGPQYGPQLQGWGPTQSREAIVRSIVKPSYDIAHSYKGHNLLLKDGTVVHGLPVGEGDPTFIMSTGGVTQAIPNKMIKKTSNLYRSLMLSAEQLGLSAQDVADIVAYMQVWK